MSKLSDDAFAIWQAGVDAVRARPLVQRNVRVDSTHLHIGDHRWARQDFDRLLVVGAGKAGVAMVQGLMDAVGDAWPLQGWVNVPEGTLPEGMQLACPQVKLHAARPAGVNEPTEAGVAGTQQILRLVGEASERDLCLVLLSGGGSALMPAPIDGISLQDKLAVTRHLSGAGADIVQLNTVRKHLSRVKGGGLLHACRAGHLVTLVLSDVLGDPLDVIASGPTVPDSTSAADAIAVLRQFDPEGKLPASVMAALQQQQESNRPANAAVPASTTIILGNNALAVDEAGIQAEKLGYNHAMTSARSSEGSAEAVGQRMAEMALRMLSPEPESHRTDCLITGGEPTVTLADAAIRGRGGRNQQLVLAAYQRLLQVPLSDSQWQRLCLLSGGTDGEDGPTDAAGARLDVGVHRKARENRTAEQLKAAVQEALRRNDAYMFFAAAGGLLKTGPTGTNVCDVRVLVVDQNR